MRWPLFYFSNSHLNRKRSENIEDPKMDFLATFSAFLTASSVQNSMNKPALPESIQQIEKSLGEQERIRGFQFPSSYKAFLLRYDGGSVQDEEGEAYVDFLSVAADEKYGYDLMRYNSEESVLLNHEIETYFPFETLVMFALDEGSNFWAFDPRYKQPDGEMPVRYCDCETGDIYTQAEDFSAFMLAFSTRQLSYRGLEEPL